MLKWRLENGRYGQYIIVGDSGYQNTMYLATPLLHPASAVEELYNESQIRTRNVVERSYGVWKRRFPVLSLGLRVQLETAQDIIVSCAMLHNICIDQREPVPPVDIEGFADMLNATNINAQPAHERNANARNIRAEFLVDYFPALQQNEDVNEIGRL